jgi:hypothetical protein
VTNQFQRYHVSWDAIRNLDHSPSLFQADFAISGKWLCRPPTAFRQSRQAEAAMLKAFGCLSVIGKTSRLPCCPRSRTVGRVRVDRPGISRELRPPRGMLIAGGKVSFAYPTIPFNSPARAVMCRSIAAIAGLAGAASSGPTRVPRNVFGACFLKRESACGCTNGGGHKRPARSSGGAHALRVRFSRSTPASITAISASI